MKENRKNIKEWIAIILLVIATIAQAVQIGQLQKQNEIQQEINKELVIGL